MIGCTRTRFVAAALAAMFLALAVIGCGDDDPAAPTPTPIVPYIYVDVVNGSADGDGTAQGPLNDLQAAIALAAAESLDVRVAEGEYEVDSAAAEPIIMDPGVSLLGGFLNRNGTWTRDPENHPSVLRDVATVGGTYNAPRATVYCQWDTLTGATPVLDGFEIETADCDGGCGVVIGEHTTVTISNCLIRTGGGAHVHGIRNLSSDRENDALVTISDCVLVGAPGGAGTVTFIAVSRTNVTIERTTVAGATVTGGAFGIDVGYGDVIITDCDVDPGVGDSTYGLYLNEAYECTVSGCTIYGGDAVDVSKGLCAMDSEASGSYHHNTIDGGSGPLCAAMELGWVESGANPAVDDNVFRCSGGVIRYGIVEVSNVADPVSLKRNVFDTSLLAGTNYSVLYKDVTGSTATGITDIDDLNALDENGLNPAGSVEGNTLTGSATR